MIVPLKDLKEQMPPEIPSGHPYWKKRRKERLIMETMIRATTPQTGWHVYQKVSRGRKALGSWTGKECCKLMLGLKDAGYLKIVGSDDDCGWLYEVCQ